MNDKTGGSAFPIPHPEMVMSGQSVKETQGMTLRDYFAASYEPDISKITGSDASSLGLPFPKETTLLGWSKWKSKLRAKLRYIEADAMLAERDK